MWILKILNLQISTVPLALHPSIFRPFTQPFLAKNFKAGSLLAPGTLSFSKMEIEDTNLGFKVAKYPFFVKEHSD